MLKDVVWLSIAPRKQGFLLHFGCAQFKLGRPITINDLNDSEINNPLREMWKNSRLY
jgi:hypothetical protein